MKKIYKLQDLECAHCAQKMQDAIAKIDGVNAVSVNFMLQRLSLDADDGSFDEIIKKAAKAIKKIEPDCRIVM